MIFFFKTISNSIFKTIFKIDFKTIVKTISKTISKNSKRFPKWFTIMLSTTIFTRLFNNKSATHKPLSQPTEDAKIIRALLAAVELSSCGHVQRRCCHRVAGSGSCSRVFRVHLAPAAENIGESWRWLGGGMLELTECMRGLAGDVPWRGWYQRARIATCSTLCRQRRVK